MDAEAIIDEAVNIVQDDSFSEAQLVSYLNSGLGITSSRVYIPDLVKTDTVTFTAGERIATLPDDYDKKSEHLYNVTNSNSLIGPYAVKIIRQLSAFNDKYANRIATGQTGDIISVCPVASNLWCVDLPEVETSLNIIYQSNPVDLTYSDRSYPTIIPSCFHYDLLVSYVAYRMFNIIEDGVADAKDNSNAFYGTFLSTLAALSEYNGAGIEAPDIVTTIEEYEGI